MPRRRPRRAQRGIALVLALWLTVLLTVIASGFAFSMRSEALAARNAVSLAQARAAADGAVERTAYELPRPRIADAWTPDGQAHRWSEGNAAIVVTAVDEAARIDLNTAPDALLKSMLMVIGGLDEPAAGALVDAIADWRDADDLRRPNGAEAPDYRAANLKYGPANAPFETIGEVARVLGDDAGGLPAHRAHPHRVLAPAGHQCGNRRSRRAARAAERDARRGRRLHRRSGRRRSRTSCRCRRSRRRRPSAAARSPSGASAPRRRCPMV